MRAVFSILFGFAWLLAAAPGMSHHSFAAVFDVSRPVDITGTVTRLEWTNPHAWIYLDVEDADGDVEAWRVELLGINSLLKQGWTPQVLNPGDLIQVTGFGARDGSNSANATGVMIVSTGEQLWVSAPRD
ncbi:MAG: hypothetical protein HKN84_07170 [Gammaproteobacteria bacterium]|nr:hypothetical protein [Gammaproteobacteria bacterium]